jgi:hypothetical protein
MNGLARKAGDPLLRDRREGTAGRSKLKEAHR